MRFIQFRSAPAENDLPAPPRTTTRTESSPSMARKAAVSSSMRTSSNALWRSGRFSVTRPTGPWCSTARALLIGDFPSWFAFSHAEHAEARFLVGRVASRGQREPEHPARIGRIDDAVVPEARGGVVRVALALVLLADRGLERLLFVLRPRALLRLDPVAAHGGQHRGGLLAAHDGDARVGPGPEEARAEGAAAHAVVPGAEGSSEDHRELRHARARDRGHHLRAVLGDAAALVLAPHHEAGDVLQEDERRAALGAELDEVRALERRLREEDPVVGDDPHRVAVQASEAGDERGAVERLELVELGGVDQAGDHFANVE